jgi:hypothetical protein
MNGVNFPAQFSWVNHQESANERVSPPVGVSLENDQIDDNSNLEEEFICKITCEPMKNPVIPNCGCGCSFEESALKDWLSRNNTCPNCREPCSIDRLIPNRTVKNAIQIWNKIKEKKEAEKKKLEEEKALLLQVKKDDDEDVIMLDMQQKGDEDKRVPKAKKTIDHSRTDSQFTAHSSSSTLQNNAPKNQLDIPQSNGLWNEVQIDDFIAQQTISPSQNFDIPGQQIISTTSSLTTTHHLRDFLNGKPATAKSQFTESNSLASSQQHSSTPFISSDSQPIHRASSQGKKRKIEDLSKKNVKPDDRENSDEVEKIDIIDQDKIEALAKELEQEVEHLKTESLPKLKRKEDNTITIQIELDEKDDALIDEDKTELEPIDVEMNELSGDDLIKILKDIEEISKMGDEGLTLAIEMISAKKEEYPNIPELGVAANILKKRKNSIDQHQQNCLLLQNHLRNLNGPMPNLNSPMRHPGHPNISLPRKKTEAPISPIGLPKPTSSWLSKEKMISNGLAPEKRSSIHIPNQNRQLPVVSNQAPKISPLPSAPLVPSQHRSIVQAIDTIFKRCNEGKETKESAIKTYNHFILLYPDYKEEIEAKITQLKQISNHQPTGISANSPSTPNEVKKYIDLTSLFPSSPVVIPRPPTIPLLQLRTTNSIPSFPQPPLTPSLSSGFQNVSPFIPGNNNNLKRNAEGFPKNIPHLMPLMPGNKNTPNFDRPEKRQKEALELAVDRMKEVAMYANEKKFKDFENSLSQLVLNARDDEGNSLLHLIVLQRGGVKCINPILIKGGDINATNREGNTPLHLAVKIKSLQTVKNLVLRGADLNKRNNDGKNPKEISNTKQINEYFEGIEKKLGT